MHSIRAADLDDLRALHDESRRRGLVFHMHVEEQRQEIADCVAAYGRRPMALLCDELELDERFTGVHCTHSDPRELRAFLGRGAGVCLCPLTEANLGDGIADLPGLLAAQGALSLGTDSNARISMVEEMRWCEHVQRLAREQRGVVHRGEGAVARTVLDAATRGGARALGLDAGALSPGAWADFATLDLDTPSLRGWDPDTLLDSWVFGAGNDAVAETCVGGRWIGPAA